LYNVFDLLFSKESQYGQLVREFRFILHIANTDEMASFNESRLSHRYSSGLENHTHQTNPLTQKHHQNKNQIGSKQGLPSWWYAMVWRTDTFVHKTKNIK
jgi:hypothetical protein